MPEIFPFRVTQIVIGCDWAFTIEGIAIDVAASYGWKLNMDLSGHRLSEFPHSAHYDGPLADVAFRPNPNLWVLEIAIAHPPRPGF